MDISLELKGLPCLNKVTTTTTTTNSIYMCNEPKI